MIWRSSAWPGPKNIITFVASSRNILSSFDDGHAGPPPETNTESKLIGIIRLNCRCVVGYSVDNRVWGWVPAGIA